MKTLQRIRELIYDLLRGKEYPRFLLAEALSHCIYPKYKFSDFGRIFLEDQPFIEWYKKNVSRSNFHTLDRKYTLNEFMKLAVDLDGDTAECGVFEGASSYLICQRTRHTSKQHHVFDSFQGLSEPAEIDGNWWEKGKLSASEEIVRQNLREFSHVRYYPGWFPERFHEVAHLKFSFVHIDVDLYQPTKDAVEFFYPRLSVGGVMMFDDYATSTCPGANLAIRTFFGTYPEPIIILTTGQAFVVKK